MFSFQWPAGSTVDKGKIVQIYSSILVYLYVQCCSEYLVGQNYGQEFEARCASTLIVVLYGVYGGINKRQPLVFGQWDLVRPWI